VTAAIAFVTAGAIAAGVIDARTGFIPDAISIPTAIVPLAIGAATGTLPGACCGAIASGGALAFLFLLTRGRGIGLGDVKLAAALGAGFGALAACGVLAAAFVGGGAYALWLLATRRASRGAQIRFGPFLAAGALLVACVPAGVTP
jgi:leader peptidase (prepilin peptidase)/N-methyltransferase